MKIGELVEFIKLRVSYTYFKNRIPKEAPDNSASVRFSGGFPTRETGIRQPSFQIIVRSGSSKVDFSKSEEIANQIFDSLTNLSEVVIGGDSIVIIRSMNSTPIFLGCDANDRPIYSLNFEMVVRP